MEQKFGVVTRWAPTSKEYLDVGRSSVVGRKNQIHNCLWTSVVKRHYLLQMKAKYAGTVLLLASPTYRCMHTICMHVDGQKIAKKLCLNIGKETKKIKSLLADFNTCRFELKSSPRIPALVLYEGDKQVLHSQQWVTDSIVNAAHLLLREAARHQTIDGTIDSFQSPQCGKKLSFKAIPPQRKYVQILHTNNNHWITVSNMQRGIAVEGGVFLYDSMYDRKSRNSHDHTMLQVCSFARPRTRTMKFHIIMPQTGYFFI